jgi:hypothetical protein
MALPTEMALGLRRAVADFGAAGEIQAVIGQARLGEDLS